MARIAGIDIPREKKIPYSLCYIHGIGLTTAIKICSEAKIDLDARVKDVLEKYLKDNDGPPKKSKKTKMR